MNVVDAIRHHSRVRPHDIAVVHSTGVVDYLQLARVISSLSRRLLRHDVARSVRVAIYVTDPFMSLALSLAAMLNGTIAVCAHPNYEPIPQGAAIDVYLADTPLPFATTARVVAVPPSWLQVEAQSGGARPLLQGEGFPATDSLARMYTSSGTTGEPKVVGHTEQTLYEMAVAAILTQPLIHGPNLSMMALSTIGGFNTAQQTLWHGCTLVLAAAVNAVARALVHYRVSLLRASPQQLQGLLQALKGHDMRFPSLHRIEVAGGSAPASLVLAARAALCTNVMGVYGSTEVSTVAQSSAGLMLAQPGAAGYVVPGVSVRIVDDAGNPVAGGVEGVVQVRTRSMATGYIGDPEASARAFRDGWFIPGDIGVLGTDGLLVLRGRTDELINAGGVKLNPALVDEFLLAQSGVRDAAAFAFRQSGRSDEVWAAVVGSDDLDEQALLAACRARLNSRAPVRLVRMGEIPRNAMGKPMRQQLSQNAKLN